MGPDDYLEDEEEPRWSFRSILASGWFRAGLLLGGIVIALALTLPYALRWMSPSDTRSAQQARRVVEPPRPAQAPAPSTVIAPPAPSVAAPVAPAVATDRPGAGDRPTPAADRSVPSTDRIVAAPERPAAESPAATTDKSAPADRPARVADKATAPREASTPPARTQAVAATPAPAPPAAGPTATVKTAVSRPAGSRDFWVQVGAFQDAENAARLQKTLRGSGMPVAVTHVARETPAPASRHEVFVTGSTPEAVTAALRGSGTARAARGGVVVQPALELKDAVAMSKRLTAEGLTVKIRRVGGDADADRGPQHVVRVGPYGSRGEATEVRRDLVGRGLAGFVAQGRAR